MSATGPYLEDPRDARDLLAALRELRGRLPVAALVGGRSRQGQRAAASHTGGMVTDARVWTALATQAGITLVTSQDDLIGVLDFFDQHAGRLAWGGPGTTGPGTTGPGATGPGTTGPGTTGPDAAGLGATEPGATGATGPGALGEGVLIVGPSGGASVIAADAFDAAGLALPPFAAAAREELAMLGLGAGSSLANPLEIPVGPGGRAELVGDAVSAIWAHHHYADVVIHFNVLSFFTHLGRGRLAERRQALG